MSTEKDIPATVASPDVPANGEATPVGTARGSADPAVSAPEPTRGDVRSESTGFAGFVRVIALLTMLSRLAGLLRESIAFKVFGTSEVWSAFNVAFVVPNLFRRLFGEGALTAAFIPEYSTLLKTDRALAGKLASLTIASLILFSGLIVLLAEAALWLVLARLSPDHPGRQAIVFTMIMLPYMPLVCATAVLGGMLQVNGRFAAPAAAPILFNGCMVLASVAWAWWLHASLEASAMAVAVAVSVSGVVQLAWCAWGLRGIVRWSRGFAAVRPNFTAMMKRFLPVTIGLGTLQLGVLADQLIAGYSVVFGPTLPWGTPYPVSTGGNAVLAYASRLYQFPLGVFGIAVATAVFPALARAWGDRKSFAETIRHGTRLSLFIGLPATVGLIVVGHTMCSVIYSSEVGRAGDVDRVAKVLMGYCIAVWAYSLTHVFNKAFYAAGDTRLPMKVSLWTLLANVLLNLVLIWPLAEAGLAWATTITATAQCLVLARIASSRFGGTDTGPLFDQSTRRGICITLLGSVVMGAVLIGAGLVWPLGTAPTWSQLALALARDTLLGIGVFGAFALLTRREELKWLLERNAGGAGAADFG